MKSSQAWSLDIMIAFVIFLSTIFIFFVILEGREGSKIEELQDEATIVFKGVSAENSDIGIVDGGEINVTKLEALFQADYTEIKKKLRVKNEFCIYLEDQDGNRIEIGTGVGIGSDIINISDEPCGP